MQIILCGINAKYIHSNLAILDLKRYAEKYGNGKNTFIIKEYTINQYVEDMLQDLYESKPDVIAFSCYIWNSGFVQELVAELKKVLPDTLLWVGGPEVSYHAKTFLKENPAVDLVMMGEGEKVFCQLSDKVSEASGEKEAFTGEIIRGAAYRHVKTGEIIDGGIAEMMDMDSIPFAYEDFEGLEHKIIYYESSRGCPFACSYCLSSVDERVRFRSLDKVLPELQIFLDAKTPQVKFVDRTFNCNKERTLTIWNYLIAHDNGTTNFHFEISADLLDEDYFAVFEKMRPGLIQLEIGVQSTHLPTVKEIRRQMNLDVLFANVDRVHAMGNIHQHLDLIVGLPEEDLKTFQVSFNDLYAHRPDQFQMGFLKVLHGTFVESKVKEYELKYRDKPPYEVLSTKWLSYGDVITLKGVEELVEMYYNSGQYKNVLEYVVPLFPTPYDFYAQFADYYKAKEYHKMNHNRFKKYEILREFLFKQDLDEEQKYIIDELLILDLYLRENVKARPAWCLESKISLAHQKEWYRTKGEAWFENQKGYDSKKAANKSHLECFDYDMELWIREHRIEKRQCYMLFDYEKKDPLSGNYRVVGFTDFM